MYSRGILYQLGRYLGRGIFFSPFLSFQESKLTLPAGSPNLKYGAEASCKRILVSKPKVWRRGLSREYLNLNLKYGAVASRKRMLESKLKAWCGGLVQETTLVHP